VREIYPIFEKVNYFVLAGVIFMNLSYNNITNNNYDQFSKYFNKSEKDKSIVIISFIFPNTQVNILNNIKIDDIITKINDHKISDVNSIKKLLLPVTSLSSGFFQLAYLPSKLVELIVVKVKEVVPSST